MSSTDEDVALLRICERPEEFRWMNFYPLERASSIPPRHRQVFVYGYAWELTRGQRSTGQAKVISRVTLGELMDKGPLPYDSDRNLIVSYDPGDMNPKGRSGGGIWFRPSLGKGCSIWTKRSLPGSKSLTSGNIVASLSLRPGSST